MRESATSPRLAVVARLPRAAVVRASYGHFYQAPPLATVSGPVLELAASQGFGFLPLRGERDHESEIGLAFPIAGLTVDATAFRNEVRDFFDHDALGNSNIFFPLTIDKAHIRGFEATISSPPGRMARFHVAYSHQTVEGEGGIVGGGFHITLVGEYAPLGQALGSNHDSLSGLRGTPLSRGGAANHGRNADESSNN